MTKLRNDKVNKVDLKRRNLILNLFDMQITIRRQILYSIIFDYISIELYLCTGDKQQAYQYHYDSYKNFPSSLDTIDWLGSYFIEMEVHRDHTL